jgi:hypothetical protein
MAFMKAALGARLVFALVLVAFFVIGLGEVFFAGARFAADFFAVAFFAVAIELLRIGLAIGCRSSSR